MIKASFLSDTSVILKYLNSLSIGSNQSSQAFPIDSWSSVILNDKALKFLDSVMTVTAVLSAFVSNPYYVMYVSSNNKYSNNLLIPFSSVFNYYFNSLLFLVFYH